MWEMSRVLSFEISGEGYNIESDAKQEHFYVTFLQEEKRTITLTVNHLKLNAVLRAVMEVDVADPPEIIALCLVEYAAAYRGQKLLYDQKLSKYRYSVLTIGRYENRSVRGLLFHFFILDAPPKNTFISYRNSEANMSSKPNCQ